MNSNIIGCDVGEIQMKGAMTSRITTAFPVPTEALINFQYVDSKVMDKRPGMYLKYLPYCHDEITGKMNTGGAYLFDTLQDAMGYSRWTTETFMVDEPKVKFWDRAFFESTERWVWDVIGAHSFAPIHEHVISRVQHWTYAGENAESALREVYPVLRSAAEKQGAASFWLLHDAEGKKIGFQLAFKDIDAGTYDEASVRQALIIAREKPSLESLLPRDIALGPLFERTTPVLTIWLPKSRARGGAELSIPLYPFVPDIKQEHQ